MSDSVIKCVSDCDYLILCLTLWLRAYLTVWVNECCNANDWLLVCVILRLHCVSVRNWDWVCLCLRDCVTLCVWMCDWVWLWLYDYLTLWVWWEWQSAYVSVWVYDCVTMSLCEWLTLKLPDIVTARVWLKESLIVRQCVYALVWQCEWVCFWLCKLCDILCL